MESELDPIVSNAAGNSGDMKAGRAPTAIDATTKIPNDDANGSYSDSFAALQAALEAEPDDEKAVKLAADAIYADPLGVMYGIWNAELAEGIDDDTEPPDDPPPPPVAPAALGDRERKARAIAEFLCDLDAASDDFATVGSGFGAVRKRVIKLVATEPNGLSSVGTFTRHASAVKWAVGALLSGLTVGVDYHRYRLAPRPAAA
jgi:hypothetical protein